MSRKNIFEMLSENNDLDKDIERIKYLFKIDKVITVYNNPLDTDEYTLMSFVKYYCFDDWKNRGHCLDFDDFLKTLDYDEYSYSAGSENVEAFFVFSEIILNCWKMARIFMEKNEWVDCTTHFNLLHDILMECLSYYNHTEFYNETTEQVLVLEDNPATTAVAEIIDPRLSLDVLKYNHHTLRGDITKKKTILLALGSELEPKRKNLHEINSNLEDGIFMMLNNLNLRHNNIMPSDNNYKDFVAKMDIATLENWYDELYQMLLLAFLEIDQIERNSKVKTLKASINGGTPQ